jgi:hypothetical protein
MVTSTEPLPLFILTQLVAIEALLRRHLPSPHPLLRLLSNIPALLLMNNHDSLTYSVLPCESCQLYMTVFKGIKSALRDNSNEEIDANGVLNTVI